MHYQSRMDCIDRALRLADQQRTGKDADEIVKDAKTFEAYLDEDESAS